MKLNQTFQRLDSNDPRDREIAKKMILAFLKVVFPMLRRKCDSLDEWQEICSIGSTNLFSSRDYPLLVMHAKNPEGYLRSVYNHALYKRRKKEARRREKHQEFSQQVVREEQDRLQSPNPSFQKDFIERLKAALKLIPQRQAEAFTLRHINGLSVKEVAVRMNIAVSTVKEHLKKSKVSLRKVYQSRGDHDIS